MDSWAKGNLKDRSGVPDQAARASWGPVLMSFDHCGERVAVEVPNADVGFGGTNGNEVVVI